jgi:hypothetical protein
MGFHILDGRSSAARRSLWATVIDQTLPLAPVFWGLVDLGASIVPYFTSARPRPA